MQMCEGGARWLIREHKIPPEEGSLEVGGPRRFGERWKYD